MKPQLENAFSRAGILYGHLVEGAGTGLITMWAEDGYINYSWNLPVHGIPFSFAKSVTVEDLCKYGLSLKGLADTIAREWREQLDKVKVLPDDS